MLRLPPHKIAHATLTQPFQCDPQPEIQETHRTTQTNTTTRCRTQRRNQFAHETTPAAPAAHTRYLSSSAAATLYGKTQGFVLWLPPHKIAHATLTQPFQCDPQPEIQETHRTTQTDTTTRCKTQRRNNSRMKRLQPQPPHSGGTFHRRLQPLYTEKHKVSCSGFLPKTEPLQHHAPFPFMVASSLPHHSPSSSLPFFTTSRPHHFPSSPLPFIITSLLHHFPSSPLPFFTTSLPHHFPSSPLPFIITSLLHHFPSSPLPFYHFPSSPLPFIITSLLHHFPSSPLPFVTTPLHHHFPSSPLPFLTTPLHHHFPSSPLPFLTTSLLHHFPWSPLPFIIASLLHPPCVIASYSFVMYCSPFIKVNCIASYSFVMYCYIMYCYVIYHPSSRSTA